MTPKKCAFMYYDFLILFGKFGPHWKQKLKMGPKMALKWRREAKIGPNAPHVV